MVQKRTKKCSICGISFPSETISLVRGKNYCEKCLKEKNKETEDLVKLRDKIKTYLSPKDSEWPLIAKQIKQFKEEYHFKYTGMEKTLDYIFVYCEDEKDFEYNNEYGIAFLPYWYNKASKYFEKVWELKKINFDDIEMALNIPGINITLKRSELEKKDEEYKEKIKKIEHNELLSLDSVEDDGIIVNDF